MPDKDPNEYFQSEIKRLNYYNSQFLKENDFNDEQLYHNQMRRLHNRALHTWGIVQGLEVKQVTGAASVTVSPGVAIDRLGQEIVLPETSDEKALGGFAAGAKVYVTIRYADVFDISDKDIKASQTASAYYMRWTERPVVSVTDAAPDGQAPDVVLAAVTLDNQKAIAQVDRSVRRYAGGRFGSSDGGAEFSLYADTAGAWHFFDGGSNADRLMVDSKGTLKVTGGDLQLDAGRELFFKDGGQIRSGDDSHRILFRRSENKLELRECGDIIFSPGATAGGETAKVVMASGGNVGIGRSPGAKLDVNGGVWTQALQFTDGNGTVYQDNWLGMSNNVDGSTKWLHIGGITDSGERRLVFGASRIYAAGNVGVGTPTPGFPLTFANVLGDKISLWGQSGNHYGFGIQSALLQIHTDTSAADIAFGYGPSGSFTETMRVKGNGNVGIGTNDPGVSKLKIAKSATDFAHLRFFGNDTGMGELETVGWASGWNINTKTAGKHLFLNRDANDTSDVLIGHYGRELTVKGDSGNVGIGTPAPTAVLHLRGKGEILLGQYVWSPSSTANSQQIDMGTFRTQVSVGDLVRMGPDVRKVTRIISNSILEVAGTFSTITGGSPVYLLSSKLLAVDADDKNVLAVNAQGSVGIGTTTPGAKLDVADTATQTMKSILARMSEGNDVGTGTFLGVKAYNTQIDPSSADKCFAIEHYFYGARNGWISFNRGGSADNGYLALSKGWQTQGQDLAEFFETAEQIAPGDVVVFDEQAELVKLCAREADSCVIGIVSSEPAGVLGTDESNAAPIALCGRVPCNVDADIAPILPGDLLTTSPTKGHAQKVPDVSRAAGAIIGKALGSLEKGKGQITVLIALA